MKIKKEVHEIGNEGTEKRVLKVTKIIKRKGRRRKGKVRQYLQAEGSYGKKEIFLKLKQERWGRGWTWGGLLEEQKKYRNQKRYGI